MSFISPRELVDVNKSGMLDEVMVIKALEYIVAVKAGQPLPGNEPFTLCKPTFFLPLCCLFYCNQAIVYLFFGLRIYFFEKRVVRSSY